MYAEYNPTLQDVVKRPGMTPHYLRDMLYIYFIEYPASKFTTPTSLYAGEQERVSNVPRI